MSDKLYSTLRHGVRDGSIVPYIGPDVLQGAIDVDSGASMPADSESLILAMNNGKPMAPKLMYEFPRAAMNLELRRGRSFINRFLSRLYGERNWSRAPLHDWLAATKPPYVADINRDTQLLQSYAGIPHTLIQGIARIGGTEYRFRIYHHDGDSYHEIPQKQVDTALPILFKPMGSPIPEPSFIASDADYVDYITELMGGFAIPAFLKEYRKGKQYLLLGMRLSRDTERMVLSNIIQDATQPTGWALIPQPTIKERRYCAKLGIEIIEADIATLVGDTKIAALAAARAAGR